MEEMDLEQLTLAELRQRAATLRIPGRSRMSRGALLAAVRDASGVPGDGRAAALVTAGPSEVEVRPDGPVDVQRRRPEAVEELETVLTGAAEGTGDDSRVERPASPTAGGAPPLGADAGFAAAPDEAGRPVVEPLQEPSVDTVYIDRGAILPESYPGTRLRVMVRDRGTLYIYWEIPPEVPGEGWEVAALDGASRTLGSFRVGRSGSSGYLNLAVEEVDRVVLRPVFAFDVAEPVAGVDLGASLPEGLSSGGPASWVEIPPLFQDGVRAPWPTTREETGTRWAVGRRRPGAEAQEEELATRPAEAPPGAADVRYVTAPSSADLARRGPGAPPEGPGGPSSHVMPTSPGRWGTERGE